MNNDVCDTRPLRKDGRSIEQDIHYARGFMQGVMFLDCHRKSFGTEKKMDDLQIALLKIRAKAKNGKDIGFVFQELEKKFRLVAHGGKYR